MAAGVFDLEGQYAVPAYATFSITFNLRDAAGDLLDLSAFDPTANALAKGMRAQFRQAETSPDPAIFDIRDTADTGAAHPGTGSLITQPATLGQFRLTVSAAQSGANTQGLATPVLAGKWDVCGVGGITVTKDYIERLVQGDFAVNKGVTRGF